MRQLYSSLGCYTASAAGGVSPFLCLMHDTQACNALTAFMQDASQFDPGIEAAAGFLSPGLAAYDAKPVWALDAKRTPYPLADHQRIGLGRGNVASAVADFVLVDMFASY